MGTFLLILLVIAVVIFLSRMNRDDIGGKNQVVFSHWYHLVENLQQSTQQFYATLEQTVGRRNLADVKTGKIDYHEGGIFTAKREYFRVRRKEHVFDICAAPYGNGFFVSWWLGEKPSEFWEMALKIPVLGPLLFTAIRPETYYKLDTALMFQSSVHHAVLEVLDQATKTQGLRTLSELERKPILSDLFKR